MNRCPKCRVKLKPGIVILQTYTGLPDFPGETRAMTMSPGGMGKLAECDKCPKCGYSRTKEK